MNINGNRHRPSAIPFKPGDIARILVHRAGILPLNPGDTATVTSIGLRNFTEPYVAVNVKLRTGTVYTSFAPEHLEHI
jgi:hypothetical protein